VSHLSHLSDNPLPLQGYFVVTSYARIERPFYFIFQPTGVRMKHIKHIISASLAALLLASCGGGGGTATSSAVSYSSLVTFGDSLSDAGTMKAGVIANTLGGGRWTINEPGNKIWVDLIAAQLGLSTPCPALSVNSFLTVTVAPIQTPQPACTNYAQGGSRVTNPVGPGNAGLLPDAEGVLGQPTTPVVTQIANHLAKNPAGKFTGTELVTVLAGGNDAFRLVATTPFTNSVVAVLTASGFTLSQASATQVVSGQVVTAMGQAGAELGGYIKNQIIANGAKKVLVVNLPNFGAIPATVSREATTPGSIALGTAMSQEFNKQLTNVLKGLPEVLIVDYYTELTKITSDASYRAQVGVTNSTSAACATNSLDGRSLVCNLTNLAVANPAGYAFADDAHPTPLGHKLLAQKVTLDMIKAGWL
jgi:outer membrane lipase/esterase